MVCKDERGEWDQKKRVREIDEVDKEMKGREEEREKRM